MVAVGLWKVFSPFIPKRTTEKARVIGTNYYPVLLQDIDPRNIPITWGGMFLLATPLLPGVVCFF